MTRPAPAPRYPLGALEHAAGNPDLHHLARLLDVSYRHVLRLRDEGLSDRQADRFAIRLGIHPAFVWADWWANTPDPRPVRRPHRRRAP